MEGSSGENETQKTGRRSKCDRRGERVEERGWRSQGGGGQVSRRKKREDGERRNILRRNDNEKQDIVFTALNQ